MAARPVRLRTGARAVRCRTVPLDQPHGNARSKRNIGGSRSLLGPTDGLMIAPAGNLWVSNVVGNAVTEYAPGARGDVKPIGAIRGSNTQLSSPFAPNANGNATPLATIAGPNTDLDGPQSLVIH